VSGGGWSDDARREPWDQEDPERRAAWRGKRPRPENSSSESKPDAEAPPVENKLGEQSAPVEACCAGTPASSEEIEVVAGQGALPGARPKHPNSPW
jgi:hypothetical protein